MRSIGARLTAWYALCATITLAVLFLLGHQLLYSRLVHGLDQLDAAEFQQLKAHLGSDYATLDRATFDRRIRETSEFSSTLFYIAVDRPPVGKFFVSRNLEGRNLPDVKGLHQYQGVIPGGSELRIDEFILKPFDLSIGTSMAQVRASMRSYVEVCLALLALMLLASIAIGFGLSRLILSPLRLIRQTANRIRSDNLSERIPVGAVKDEISDLALLLNQTFDRLEQAFDQTRRFADEASHELKTPLSLVRLHAEQLLTAGHLSPADAEALGVILEEVARLNKVIEDLLFLSRAEADAIALNATPQPPAPFLEQFHQDASVLTSHHGLRFEYAHGGEGEAAFEAKWVRQVLLNLLSNAIKASPPGGRILLRSQVGDGAWRLAMEDEGPGLDADQRLRMFHRFVRFDKGAADDKGAGLGLAICRTIVAMHAGRIWADAIAPRRGLRVSVEIPLTRPTEAARTGL